MEQQIGESRLAPGLIAPPIGRESSFDAMVRRLGLKESQYTESRELMSWVRQHHENRYVPEWLIEKAKEVEEQETLIESQWEYWNTFLGRRVEYNWILKKFRVIGGQVTVTA